MSNKISQKELLNEGFWDAFGKAKERLREKFPKTTQLASLAGSVADVVAPEIMQPWRKQKEWRDSASEKAKRASMTQNEITMDYIHEDGFHELQDQKLQWNPKRNADGTYTATIKVGELVNDETTGKPKLGRTFSSDKSTYIVKFDPKTRTAKRVKGPERHLASSHEQIRHALEDAGHDVVGTLTQLVTNRDGTITGFAKIKINGHQTQKTFVYDPSTENVTIT